MTLAPLEVAPVVNAARIRAACDRIESLWAPSLYPDKVISEGPGAPSEGSRPPIPIGGISLRADIARRLHHWADLALTHGGLPRLQHLTNLSALAAVRWNADWLAQNDPTTGRDGEYLAEELEDHAERLASHTMPTQPQPDNSVGECPSCTAGRLFKPSGGDLIECDQCTDRAPAWQWWERRFPDLAEDVSQQDIADRYKVKLSTVSTWVERRALQPINPGSRPLLYRWANVRWVLEYQPRTTQPEVVGNSAGFC